ncbi:MAG: V-type ATPase subunit [Candidatus Hodarchaeales archaeon]|jgi:vacuolar-type H+-ATPase subunit C/Vma6
MAFHQIREAKEYSFINARVKARRSQLLTTSDYEHLLSSSVQEGINYLQTKPRYQGTFEELDVNLEPHTLSLQLENLLEENVYSEIFSLLKNIPPNAQEFFLHYFKKPYIKKLEHIIYKLHKPDSEEFMDVSTFIMTPEDKVELNLAAKASDFQELGNFISTPWIKNALKDSILKFQSSNDIFDVTSSLEHAFYSELWKKKIENLKRISKAIAEKVIGIEIDLINISLLIRWSLMKKRLHSVEKLLIPIQFRLKPYFARLKESRSLSNLLTILESTFYADYSRLINQSNLEQGSLENLEQIQQEFFLQSLTGILAGYPFHLGILLGYYYFRLQEVENLRIIFESKIKQINVEFTRKMLIYTK